MYFSELLQERQNRPLLRRAKSKNNHHHLFIYAIFLVLKRTFSIGLALN